MARVKGRIWVMGWSVGGLCRQGNGEMAETLDARFGRVSGKAAFSTQNGQAAIPGMFIGPAGVWDSPERQLID